MSLRSALPLLGAAAGALAVMGCAGDLSSTETSPPLGAETPSGAAGDGGRPQSSGAGSGGDGPAAEFAGAGAMTEVDAAGAGSSADPGAAGGDDGAVDDDEPGDGVPTPGGYRAVSRLTRAEYAATVRSAFGVEVDVWKLPEDGRVERFTSNVLVTPDPVHPYLLVAEELADQLIPDEFPVCGADAGCLEEEYRDVFEALFRRPLRAEEYEAFAQQLEGSLALGLDDTGAQRALIASVLLSPDFMYRTALQASAEASELSTVLEQLSFALWDAPPDESLRQADLGDDERAELATQAERVLQDERAADVITRFVGQWLHVDVDLQLEAAEFAESPDYLEVRAWVEQWLAAGRPVQELVAGPNALVHSENAERYGVALADVGNGPELLPWPEESARRGVLGQELFAAATRHPDASRRPIFRGLLIRESLLCDTIPPPTAELVALAGEVGERTSDPRCAGCHRLIDPIGAALAAWDDENDAPPAELISHPELEGTYASVPELLAAVAQSEAFAECFARQWLSFLLEVPIASIDPGWALELASEVRRGASLQEVLALSLEGLQQRLSEVSPWCGGL